jgi:hypothetical protein
MYTLSFRGGVARLEIDNSFATISFHHRHGEHQSSGERYEICFDVNSASEGYLERRGVMPAWLKDEDLAALIIKVSNSAMH